MGARTCCGVFVLALPPLLGAGIAWKSYQIGGWASVAWRNPRSFSAAAIPPLDGRVAVVTGGNTGIGKATVKELVRKGAHVVFSSRDSRRGHAARMEVLFDTGKDPGEKGVVDMLRLDLGSFKSVRAFAEQFKAKKLSLHILVLNAGVMGCEFGATDDGYETQFGTNHLGHFLLTSLLLDTLVEKSRVVVVSSLAHLNPYPEGIRFDSLRGDAVSGYDPMKAYGQSKLANVLFSQELSARLKGRSVLVNAVHPGVIFTELGRHLQGKMEQDMGKFGWKVFAALYSTLVMGSWLDGALTQLWVATSPDVERGMVSGKYFDPVAVEAPVGLHAQNATLQQQLWEWSVAATDTADIWRTA